MNEHSDLSTVGGDAADRIMAKTASLGGYFALQKAASPDWLEFEQLLDPTVVSQFVADTRSAIARSTNCAAETISVRLAASSFQLGVAARLLSPIMGSATSFGAVPLLTPEHILWRRNAHAPAFALADVEIVEAAVPEIAAKVIAKRILPEVFDSLNDILRATSSLSHRVTRGNIASAANGAVTVLATTEPRLESRGRALVRALLDTEALAGAGDFAGSAFIRRSCCLFYLAPNAGLCGDCVLTVSRGSHQFTSG